MNINDFFKLLFKSPACDDNAIDAFPVADVGVVGDVTLISLCGIDALRCLVRFTPITPLLAAIPLLFNEEP